MRGLLADCKHAIRLYRSTPGSSLIAVLVLAVGTAFVAAFLSLYVDLVLRPHQGFEQSDRLATIGQNLGTDMFGVPFELIDRLSDEMASIEAAAIWSGSRTLIEPYRGDTSTIAMVSREFFSGLRPRLALGRGLRPEDHEPDAEPVAVLSFRYWQQRFGGDRNILGTTIEITRDPDNFYRSANFLETAEPEQDSARFRVVGVTDQRFSGVPTPVGSLFEPRVWLPLERVWPLFVGVPETLASSSGSGSYIRRSSGASTIAIANELRTRYDESDTSQFRMPGTRLDAIDGLVGDINVKRDAKRQLELILISSGLLAIVAAANVSLFLLARAPGRRREIGIRMAVGAPVRRLARQLATEAALLVSVSAGLGLSGSVWLDQYLGSLAFLREAEWNNVTLFDWRVTGLVIALLLILSVIVALAPMLGLRRHGISASSRATTARASATQRLSGTAQIAIAGTVGGAAIAFGWQLALLTFGHPGYETQDLYFARSGFRGTLDSDTRIVEVAQWRDEIEAIPGVTAIAFGGPVPGMPENRFPFQIPDPFDPSQQLEIFLGEIDRSFVDLLGLRVLHGRIPEAEEPNVVAVNETLAQMVWGRVDVVGERLSGTPQLGAEGSEVVGVLEDLSFAHPAAAPRPYFFRGYANLGSAVIQSQLTAGELRQALERVESGVNIRTLELAALEPMRSDLIAPDRARSFLTMMTAAIVVFLAAFGFYGTQRYLVAAGRHEYAIRAALGAGPKALGRLVIRRGLMMSLPGLITGGLLAFIAVAWLRDEFLTPAIRPAVVTLSIVIALVVLLSAASLGPARKAKQTLPAPLLRED